MDNVYYDYTIEHSGQMDELHRANAEALICLKARAFLDLVNREANGEKVDEKDIRKHKNDVFRLAAMLTGDDHFELPDTIKADMFKFADAVKDNLPDNAILKEMKAFGLEVRELFAQFRKNFNLGT
jgi:hypothetical protein